MMNRRHFLRSSAAGLGVGAGFATNLLSLNAFAADASDYKALVCVFMFGGLDGHDTIIPYDQASYDQYASIREPLLSLYDEQGAPRRRENLLPLSGNLGGRQFAVPSEMSALHALFEAGDAAVVGNVGPLIEPLTEQTFSNRTGHRPAKLFSHNDQQSTWMASQPEGAPTGWGGRFADVLAAAQANSQAAFTTMAIERNSLFLTGETVYPFISKPEGAANVHGFEAASTLGAQGFNQTYLETITDSNTLRSNLFQRDFAQIATSSLENNQILNEQLALPGDPTVEFASDPVSRQLQMIARMIARRNSMGMKRQIFFVNAEGFDSHSAQASELPKRQAGFANAISSFYDALKEMGVENSVTTFTASDFGRTLAINGDGTDHGWGGHHFVVGGAVRGRQIVGDVPPPEFGHEFDAGRGRLIPQVSVDQYAGSLGKWFGLSDNELTEVMPGIGNFDRSTLDPLFI